MTKEIYLDLDGVCVDFIRGAISAHGLDAEQVLTDWAQNHRGEFLPYRVLDMEMDPFWNHLASLGEAFWIQLEPYPWFDELFRQLNDLGHVVFCTSTTRSPACVSGKLHWLQNRFGVEFQDYILTPHKDRLAHPNAYLIDDYDQNVDRFSERGGIGVLFPQIWNSNHALTHSAVEYVLDVVAH
jgi:5'(3')-deoxyribonucleotidase